MSVLHVLVPVTLSVMTVLGALSPVSRPPDGTGAKRGPQIALTRDTVNSAKDPKVDTFTPPLLGPLRYGIDTTVSPCVDFFQYVNGGWRAQTKLGEVTPGQPKFVDVFGETPKLTRLRIQEILDSARTVRTTTKDPTLKVVGMFYESCLTVDTLESPIMTRGRPKPKTPPKEPKKEPNRKVQCLNRTLDRLGAVVGQAFAQNLLTPHARGQMEQMLEAIRGAVIEHAKANPLLNESEKSAMLESMQRLTLRVGMPKELVDYTPLVLTADYYENKKAIANFESLRQVNAIGADRREKFKASLLEQNARYSSVDHAIEVPPVMFLPPYFDAKGDVAVNFGGVGIVISHEIFHSLSGKIDMAENPEMKKQIERLKTFHSSLGELDGWNTDGNRTYFEDVADLGAVLAAYNAWKATVKANKNASSQLVEGFTPDQRFFLGIGRIWRAKWSGVSIELSKDEHSAPFARVNGMAMQSPAFAKAFGCKPTDPMVPSSNRRVTIW